MKDIELGTKVKDKVTGIIGIATTKLVFLNGCVQYCIKPKKDKDSKVVDGVFVDSQQVEIVDKGLLKNKKKEKSTGGVMPDTPIL